MSVLTDEHAELTGIQWNNPFFPAPVLDNHLALLYFECPDNPFFNVSCNNTAARAQQQDPAQPGVLESQGPGLEYALAETQPPHLFVIEKRQRINSQTALPISWYYILDKNVYQAPRLAAVMNSRVQRCLWRVKQGFARLQKDLDPLAAAARAAAPLPRTAAPEAAESTEQAVPDSSGGLGACSRQEAVGSTSSPDPLDVPRRLGEEEQEAWRRADAAALRVLARYPAPQVPAEWFVDPTAAAGGALVYGEPAPG